jgi:hypothetical protein
VGQAGAKDAAETTQAGATTDAAEVNGALDRHRTAAKNVATARANAGEAAMTRIMGACGPPAPGASGPMTDAPQPLLNTAEANAYVKTVGRSMQGSQKPGVLWDQETGMTYDSQDLDANCDPKGAPHNASAASKEALDVIILVKTLLGEEVPQLTIAEHNQKEIALDRLTKKITTIEVFNAEYPGFGGFLPWFKVTGEPGHRRMVPLAEPGWDWTGRVPGLDNGELGWAVYYAYHALMHLGQEELAERYRAQFELMRRHVVTMFYDAERKALRAEATSKFGATGMRVPVEKNEYITNRENPYYLDDSAEGMAMVDFAVVFGDWHEHPEGPEALERPRKIPTVDEKYNLTVAKEWRFSAHEEWADLEMPTRDGRPNNELLFGNAQRERTNYAAENNMAGMYASTHLPDNGTSHFYSDRGGIPSVSWGADTEAEQYFAPYGVFPLALIDKNVFATWLKNGTNRPGVMNQTGIVDSFTADGKAIAPLVSWDGQALIIIAWTGGISDDVRRDLIDDQLYFRFLEAVRREYAQFDDQPIHGIQLPLRVPLVGVPRPVLAPGAAGKAGKK